MNLLFSINQKAVPLLLSCVRSILRSGGGAPYEAYVLHSDLDEAAQASIAGAFPEDIAFHFLPVDPALFDGFPETSRYPQQIYYRIAAPLLLPDTLDRILYLDVDLVVINPLGPLYYMEFEDAYYIACTHTPELLTKINQTRLGVGREVPYINTGVLLFNLPPLREALNMDDVRAYAERKRHALVLPDQDILTGLYGDRIKLADTMRYNLSDRILALHNADLKRPRRSLAWVRRNTVIIHYCGRNKPWKDGYIGTLGVFYDELEHPADAPASVS